MFNLSTETLMAILICTLASGLVTLCVTSFLSVKRLQNLLSPLVSLSIGFILSLCFLHGLPELFNHADLSAHTLFAYFLGSILVLFLMEKFKLFRHDHHHEHDGHQHTHGFNKQVAGHLGFSILIGSSIHHFSDGMLIAAAFFKSTQHGFTTSLGVIMHEVPQLVGDFILLLGAGLTRRRAITYTLLSCVAIVLGAITVLLNADFVQAYLPYCLIVGYSMLTYVAISDLLPQIQEHKSRKEWITQLTMLTLGLAIMYAILEGFSHEHDEHDEHAGHEHTRVQLIQNTSVN